MKAHIYCWVFLIACSTLLPAQKDSAKQSDIDPLALKVLKTVTDPIEHAKAYSFRAIVSRETLGSNGQIITLFHVTEATVAKPDKLRLNILGVGKEVQLFYNAGHATLFTPETKFFTTISSPTTLDATLDSLEKKNIFIPIRNFLSSNPYKSLSDSLRSAYVVGRVQLADQEVHQLAFTEPDAEWQIWVIGGDKPQIVRLEVVDKSKPYNPRTIVQFLDWNLSPQINSSTFTFNKPADAKYIELMTATEK
ncbi:MAG TPA: DUF2092 domain-containing protein [Terriglobales bacterium]|jgi:hypothetical protein